MKVLIACEYSGVVREAFADKGHYAMSCDLLPTDHPGSIDRPANHYQGDVFDILYDDWDLVIAHPPCTFLCNSGVRWLDRGNNVPRWNSMIDACEFFNAFKKVKCPYVIENPIMHKYARERCGKQSQVIQPWMFGHGETKATCLWLKDLPLLKPTNIVEGREQRIWKMGPSKDRWKERSKTYEGIAKAMADQWSI